MALLSLPDDILDKVSEKTAPALDDFGYRIHNYSYKVLAPLLALTQTSRRLHIASTRHLYSDVRIINGRSLLLFMRTILERPHWSRYVHSLTFFLDLSEHVRQNSQDLAPHVITAITSNADLKPHIWEFFGPFTPFDDPRDLMNKAVSYEYYCGQLLFLCSNLRDLQLYRLTDNRNYYRKLAQTFSYCVDSGLDFLPRLSRLVLFAERANYINGEWIVPRLPQHLPQALMRAGQVLNLHLSGAKFENDSPPIMKEAWRHVESIDLSGRYAMGAWFDSVSQVAEPRLKHVKLSLTPLRVMERQEAVEKGLNAGLLRLSDTVETLSLRTNLVTDCRCLLGRDDAWLSCLPSLGNLTSLDVEALLLFESPKALRDRPLRSILPSSLELISLHTEEMYDLNWSEVEVLSDEQGTGGWRTYSTLFFGVLQELVCETSDWLPRLQKVTLIADDSFWEKKESKLWTRILSVDPPDLGRNYTTYVIEYALKRDPATA